jgi:two-component system chemotaxis sensor kinase CheA
MDGMVFTVGDQTMVVPISSVLETIRPSAKDISRIGLGDPLLSVRGQFVPVIDLATNLGHPPSKLPITEQVLLLVNTEKLEQCAFAVDAISDQRQVVIKSLEGNYGHIPGVSAATILGDGKIALIIDPDGIAAAAATPIAPLIENPKALESSHV